MITIDSATYTANVFVSKCRGSEIVYSHRLCICLTDIFSG